MERIGIIGLSLREAEVPELERLARAAPERFNISARELADELGASELVLLQTCNRVEVVYARELGDHPSESDRLSVARRLGLAAGDGLVPRLHFHAGREAVQYLFRVASSLDSLVLGEDQILAQVREAYQACERAGLVGRLLGALFEHSLQIGKSVRTETELSRIPVSVVSLGLSEIRSRFEGSRPRLALVGAGAMAELVVKNAAAEGLAPTVIVNRGLERAQQLARTCGAQALTLAGFLAGREGYDVLVTATASPTPILDRSRLEAFARATPLGRPLLAVDLSLPRNVEVCRTERIEVIDLERLRERADSNRALRAEAARAAEAMIERKLASFVRRSTEALVQEAIAEMNAESESVFERELSGLLGGKLARLAPEDRLAVEHWARSAFGRVAHVPIRTIKRLAGDSSFFDADHTRKQSS